MKFNTAVICTAMITLCTILSSCDEDSRTGVQGYPGCSVCHGKGYCEKSELLGLTTSYWDCFLCKSRNARRGLGGYNPTFQGHGVVRGSCNIASHKCPGYHDNGNSECSNCTDAGFACHAVNHQGI